MYEVTRTTVGVSPELGDHIGDVETLEQSYELIAKWLNETLTADRQRLNNRLPTTRHECLDTGMRSALGYDRDVALPTFTAADIRSWQTDGTKDDVVVTDAEVMIWVDVITVPITSRTAVTIRK